MRQVDGTFPMIASENLAAYLLVNFDGVGAAVYDTTGGTGLIGVVQEYTAAGEMAAIRPRGFATGISIVTADGAVDAGDEIYADENGEVTADDLGTAIGIALTATGASGGLLEALLY